MMNQVGTKKFNEQNSFIGRHGWKNSIFSKAVRGRGFTQTSETKEKISNGWQPVEEKPKMMLHLISEKSQLGKI